MRDDEITAKVLTTYAMSTDPNQITETDRQQFEMIAQSDSPAAWVAEAVLEYIDTATGDND